MSDQDYELDTTLQQQRKARREEMRRKRILRRNIIYAALAIILILIIVLAVRSCTKKDEPAAPPDTEQNEQLEGLEPVTPDDTPEDPAGVDATATLAAVGDIMCYQEQIDDAQQADGSLDFSPAFAQVQQALSSADLTIANLETNFAGEPYTGYPNFSSPPELAQALAAAGVDIAQTANTYSLENGLTGLQSTITTLAQNGMQAAGTYASQQAASENGGVLLREVNGIRFAFLAFTKGVNGRTLPTGSTYCTNVLYTDYNGGYTTVDETALLDAVTSAKQAEADVIIALLHWGGEYETEPDATQEQIADLLFLNGVDVILGSHSHMVGQLEKRTVTTADGETKDVFLAYSLGNFYSSMDRENTRASMILNITFFKSGQTGQTTITDIGYRPVYIADLGEQETDRYVILDIAAEIDAYIGGAEDRVSETLYNEIRSALEFIHSVSGSELDATTAAVTS